MLVLHTIWSNRAVHLWAESASQFLDRTADAPVSGELAAVGSESDDEHSHPAHAGAGSGSGSGGSSGSASGGGAVVLDDPATPQASGSGSHPFAVSFEHLRGALLENHILDAATLDACTAGSVALQLPWHEQGPRPSDWLAASVGDVEFAGDVELHRTTVPTLEVPAHLALHTLLEMENAEPAEQLHVDHDTRYWMAIARFAIELIADQRFVPTLIAGTEQMRAVWYPWLDDSKLRDQLGLMLAAMPPVVRAIDDGTGDGRGWTILSDALGVIINETVRAALIADDFSDAIAGRDATDDQHVAWLGGLLDREEDVTLDHDGRMNLRRGVGSWVGALCESAANRAMQLVLRLEEPLIIDDSSSADGVDWTLSFHLRPADAPDELIDVQQLWSAETSHPLLAGMKTGELQELVLTELARASRVWSTLESALSQTVPQTLSIQTAEAYQLLSEVRPVLTESGVDVLVPQWWGRRSSRLGARLHIEPAQGTQEGGATAGGSTRATLGLESLVEYQWHIAIGDDTLSREEFEQLAKHRAPLVRMHGQWIEVRREDYEAAVRLMHDHPSGEATLRDAFRLAHGGRADAPDLPVFGMDASGWVRDVLDASEDRSTSPARS